MDTYYQVILKFRSCAKRKELSLCVSCLNTFRLKKAQQFFIAQSEKDFKLLCQTFECFPSQILQIEIKNSQLTNSQIEALSKSLQENQSIQSLNLSGNNITAEGAVTLSMFLQSNESLIDLDISSNQIRSEGLEEIIEGLGNSCIQLLKIDENQIDEITSLVQFAQQNNTLQYLSLSNNPLRFNSYIKLFDSLAVNSTLQIVDISNCIDVTQKNSNDELLQGDSIVYKLAQTLKTSHLQRLGIDLPDQCKYYTDLQNTIESFNDYLIEMSVSQTELSQQLKDIFNTLQQNQEKKQNNRQKKQKPQQRQSAKQTQNQQILIQDYEDMIDSNQQVLFSSEQNDEDEILEQYYKIPETVKITSKKEQEQVSNASAFEDSISPRALQYSESDLPSFRQVDIRKLEEELEKSLLHLTNKIAQIDTKSQESLEYFQLLQIKTNKNSEKLKLLNNDIKKKFQNAKEKITYLENQESQKLSLFEAINQEMETMKTTIQQSNETIENLKQQKREEENTQIYKSKIEYLEKQINEIKSNFEQFQIQKKDNQTQLPNEKMLVEKVKKQVQNFVSEQIQLQFSSSFQLQIQDQIQQQIQNYMKNVIPEIVDKSVKAKVKQKLQSKLQKQKEEMESRIQQQVEKLNQIQITSQESTKHNQNNESFKKELSRVLDCRFWQLMDKSDQEKAFHNYDEKLQELDGKIQQVVGKQSQMLSMNNNLLGSLQENFRVIEEKYIERMTKIKQKFKSLKEQIIKLSESFKDQLEQQAIAKLPPPTQQAKQKTLQEKQSPQRKNMPQMQSPQINQPEVEYPFIQNNSEFDFNSIKNLQSGFQTPMRGIDLQKVTKGFDPQEKYKASQAQEIQPQSTKYGMGEAESIVYNAILQNQKAKLHSTSYSNFYKTPQTQAGQNQESPKLEKEQDGPSQELQESLKQRGFVFKQSQGKDKQNTLLLSEIM